MLSPYMNNYYYMSQSVPNLFFTYRAPVIQSNFNNYPYYPSQYDNLYYKRYDYYNMAPKLIKSKNSFDENINSERPVRAKSRNGSIEAIRRVDSYDNLIEKEVLGKRTSKKVLNHNGQVNRSEIKVKKRLRFIDTYRDKNYEELKNSDNSDKESDKSDNEAKRRIKSDSGSVHSVKIKNDVNNSSEKLYRVISDKDGLLLLKEVV
ncbi:unnamed protein product [Brachionus calyciflorus]|uniref:Uncharacterized protein n=1 Tax=Brachionus calyciflorus TaxID=104777 RepID=A0A813UX55_9BILA|nr:unnamed protein product [Brachionus calyciflorus]